jgi:hypothetical protein
MSVARHELQHRPLPLRLQRALAALIAEKCALEVQIQEGHFDRQLSRRLDSVQQAIESVQAVLRAYEDR